MAHPITPNEQVAAYVVYGATAIILHAGRRVLDWVISLGMLLTGAAGWLFGFYIASHYKLLSFRDFVALVVLYSIYAFIILSEIMMRGFRHILTRWRGENWTKEMDYLYIALGAIGLVASINRFGVIENKIDFPDVYSALALATALVLRAIKTRAEINGWNKFST